MLNFFQINQIKSLKLSPRPLHSTVKFDTLQVFIYMVKGQWNRCFWANPDSPPLYPVKVAWSLGRGCKRPCNGLQVGLWWRSQRFAKGGPAKGALRLAVWASSKGGLPSTAAWAAFPHRPTESRSTAASTSGRGRSGKSSSGRRGWRKPGRSMREPKG